MTKAEYYRQLGREDYAEIDARVRNATETYGPIPAPLTELLAIAGECNATLCGYTEVAAVAAAGVIMADAIDAVATFLPPDDAQRARNVATKMRAGEQP